MQPKDQFYPDIETKYDHLITHMTDKNKMTEQLIKIMKEICTMQIFYSNTLDKFANSVSKLLVGKDPIKDILIVYQRILASKCEQSQKLATSIKNDLIPYLEQSIDPKAQQKLKDSQKQVKQMRFKMQKKLRSLYNSEKNFKSSITQIKNLPNVIMPADKQKLQNQYKKRQLHFNQSIDSFNGTLDEYMVKYAQICQQLSEIQTKRKYHLRDTIRKLVIMQMDYLKNIEYNLTKYMESLDKMEGKLLIQERIMTGGQPFYDRSNSGVIQLAKLSNKNYIDHCIGKKNLQKMMSKQELAFRQIRSTYPAGVYQSDKFEEITKKIFKIIDYAFTHMDPFLLKQIVLFAKDLHMPFQGLKIGLLQNILCHPIFTSEQLWQIYGNRLYQKMNKQEGYLSNHPSEKNRILNTLIKNDMEFLRMIEINPYITTLLRKLQQTVSVPIKSVSTISEQNIKSNPEITIKRFEQIDIFC